MSYELEFIPLAKKEWDKLGGAPRSVNKLVVERTTLEVMT